MQSYTKLNSSKTSMKKGLTRFFNYIWYQSAFWHFLLAPLSLLYRLVLFAKSKINTGSHPASLSVPIIVVGNITVGGTGKTPLVIALVNFLKTQGFRPGVVSRGYGGSHKEKPLLVTPASDVKIIGDEALLIATHTQCPVMICQRRIESTAVLIKEHQCNIIVSDDGLQHKNLPRQYEIVVVDGCRGFGNGFCLPAGPLREPVSRLKTVNSVIVNGKRNTCKNIDDIEAAKKPLFEMELVVNGITSVRDFTKNRTVESLKDIQLYAVAGIGNPQRFFNTLRELSLSFFERPFPDHYNFKREDFDFLPENALIIMTEKDAVKCQDFANEQFWFLSVSANVDRDLLKSIASLIQG